MCKLKIQVIPDIHNQGIISAEIAIEYENADLVIFLGDYFDSYTETFEDVVNTATWLKSSLEKKNRIHLWGNHDIWYSCGLPYIQCPGNNERKRFVINNIIKNWDNLYTYAWAGDYLCTHAGLTNPIYEAILENVIRNETGSGSAINAVLDDIGSKVTVKKDRVHPALSIVGRGRGGSSDHGGILWCHFELNPDYNEFKPVAGLKQIFGHTASDEWRKIGNNYCIDTFGKYYAVIENDKLEIRNVNKIGSVVKKK